MNIYLQAYTCVSKRLLREILACYVSIWNVIQETCNLSSSFEM